ncbi:ThyX-like thymidylate synthase [Rhodococcus phage Peregrin]|nr:ThyX-like thymidylate synthase [Rhodococcus phage Peregrin]
MTELPEDYIKVLDKGYVGFIDKLGTDITPARAARTSFKKSPESYTQEQNERLVKYLITKKEMACFRHNAITFEIKMPLMIARQLWKYVVGSSFTEDQLGWNENSRRYITDENEYYIPNKFEWRTAPENKKQGSGPPMNKHDGEYWANELEKHYSQGEGMYNAAMNDGAAPELARLFLGAYGLYVTCVWTASLNSLFHVLEERLDSHAQYEIQLYAKAIRDIVKETFPVSFDAWDDIKNYDEDEEED